MGYLYQDGNVFSSARNKNGKPVTDVEVKESTVKDSFSGSANITKNYTDPMDTFAIVNKGSSSLTFTINGLTISVDAGEGYEDIFDPFTTVTVTTTVAFKAQVKGKGGNVVIDTTAPNNVTNLQATNLAGTSLTLTWTASSSSDVSGYDVYNGATKLGSVTGTTYNVTGLSPSTTYTFWVKAKDASGNIASGTSVQATTTATADTTAPNPVTNLTAGTVTSSSIPVSWTLSSSGDVANYEVAYSSNGGSSYTVASAVVNPSSTSYTVNGLSASTAYVIRVVAIDGAGNRSTPVTVNATTSAAADTTPPTVTASPLGGSYSSAQSVTLSTEAGATIYYTTDGSTPTYPVSGTTQTYSTPISVSATTTLKYIGRDTAGNVSAVQTQTYTIGTIAYVNDASLKVYYDFKSLVSTPATITDSSGNGNNGTLYGYAGTATSGINNGELISDGTGDYIQIPHNASLKTYPFTLEYYIKVRNRATSPPTSVTIFDDQLGAGTGNGVRVYLNNASNATPNVIGYAGSLSQPPATNTSLAAFDDVYRHIVIVFGASNQKVYVDGVKIADNNATSTTLGARDLYLFTAGNGLTDTAANSCKLFRFYNKELTQAEVTQNYNAAIA